MYEPVWQSILAESGQEGLLVPANGCLPTVEANISRACVKTAAANLAEIAKLPRARTVIIGLTWSHDADLVDSAGRPLAGADDSALISAIDDLIDRLHRMAKKVVLIGPLDEPGWDVASTLSRQIAFHHPLDRPTSVPAAQFMQRFGAAIRHFEARRDIGFARPDRVECPADRCFYLIDGRSLFSDSNHLARAELERFRAPFEAALQASAASQP